MKTLLLAIAGLLSWYAQAVLALPVRITGVGVYENVEAQVDKTHSAVRVSIRPVEKGVFGSYSAMFSANAFAAGAVTNTVLMAVRWTAPGANMLLRRVFGAIPVTTSFALGDVALDVIRATVAPAQYTNGQNVTFRGKDGARSTRFPTSLLGPIAAAANGNIAVASGGTGLTAPGTAWTLDDQPLGRFSFSMTTASGFSTGLETRTLWEAPEYRDPLEVQNGEGFLVRGTWPATGVPTPWVGFEWDEVDPARYYGLFG